MKTQTKENTTCMESKKSDSIHTQISNANNKHYRKHKMFLTLANRPINILKNLERRTQL